MNKTNADKVIYCDMDGVLADFNSADPNAELFRTKKHFFRDLAPISKNIDGLKLLALQGAKIYILSATPHRKADADKRKWLKKHLPFIPKSQQIFVRIGANKADYIKERGILFDDYGKNCLQWRTTGMVAYKVDADDTIYQYALNS